MQSILNDPQPEAWRQIAPLLDAAMAQLGQKDHDALVLRFFEGRNFKDVGAALGAGEDAAKMRVTRALEKLRKFFTKRGVVSTTTVIAGAISANSIQAAPTTLASAATVAALVKGATASGSSLTIIKGALKLMAWTKMKTAAVTVAIVLLGSISAVVVTERIRHLPPRQTGRLKLPTGNVAPMVGYGYSRYGIILASDGSLWSWGEERLGWPVLGLDDKRIHNTTCLRRIGTETDWASIAVGESHDLAIKSDGTLWGWGGNFRYQLGDGTKITRTTPVQSIHGNDWKQAACGAVSSMALKNDGTLWAWGDNWAGNLGIGSTKATTNAVQVGTGSNWKKIWAGGIQCMGLQNDGSLWFWGSYSGQTSEADKHPVPKRVSTDTNWTDVCFGYFTVFAIKSDGTLWCWGREARFYSKTRIIEGTLTPVQVGSDSDWAACNSSEGGFYQLLKKRDGSIWCMDASDHRRIKPDTDYQPVKFRKIDVSTNIAAFTSGSDDFGALLTKDGEVWTWGRVIGELSRKDYKQKGDPSDRVIATPWQVSNIE